ncbi:S-acyltransferase [Musa troglodytarum]|uniref:S-acyltransferase n=1 Tax=Musa troglodytarum TaxID=320322 RepID=A0A9E7EMR6_9LILI|nr:S-acyltransferase [Musa troglodytarum]
MVRRHGWQLPAHNFQVVAITVFFLLVVAFYAFFAPFLGKDVIEYASIAVYTPVALAVFILYVRCTRINPADPGIMSKFDDDSDSEQKSGPSLRGIDCRKHEVTEQQPDEDDALFCTLCNAELAIEIGVGIAVFVLCFVDKKGTEANIKEKLGNGFSRGPVAAIIAICIAVSLLACVPLGELFFFHMILIKKGITTYEYVVAMRAMSEAPPASGDEEEPNILYSPTNSATTSLSIGSSLGLQYKGVWCTPPRVFVDQQDEVISHLGPGMVPSTVDPDAAGSVERANKSKKAVKISAWKLAKLDSNEAIRAAAKARASSSVLRPIEAHHVPHTDGSSSGNASMRSSLSADYSASKESRSEVKLSPLRNSELQSIASKEDFETGTQTASSLSSPVHIYESVVPSSLPLQHPVPERRPPHFIPRAPPTTQNNTMFQSSAAVVRDNKRATVVWDQEAGRFVSVPAAAGLVSTEVPPRTSQVSLVNPCAGTSTYDRRATPLKASSSVLLPSSRQERLVYTGRSIFFGEPLLNDPVRDAVRNNSSSDVIQGNNKESNADHAERGDELFYLSSVRHLVRHPPFPSLDHRRLPPISETGDPPRTDSSVLVSVRPQISLRPLLEQAVDVSRNPPSLPPTLDGLVSSWAGPASKKRLEIPRRKTKEKPVTVGKKNGALLDLPAGDSYNEVGLSPPRHKRYANNKRGLFASPGCRCVCTTGKEWPLSLRLKNL